MSRPSIASKAVIGMLATIAGAIAATFPDTMLGKVCVVAAAGLGALAAVYVTKNTVVVTTGDGDLPVTLGTVVSDTGAVVGTVTADTGAAAGGVIAGTTGVLGGILDATLGKLLPAPKARKH